MAPGGVIAHSRSHCALETFIRSTRQLHPRCEHFAFSCFSYLIFIFLRLATLALRLGVIAGSWLRSEAYVLPYWSAAFVLVSLVLLFLAVHRYG